MEKLLKDLCAINGVSGCEDAVRDEIWRQAAPFSDQMEIDRMGNLIVHKKGAKRPSQRLMLLAHMDEVGLIIKHITDEGYLKFGLVGGIDRRVLIGKRVEIGANRIPGIIGLKAYHLVNKSEEKKVPQAKDLYIDIGAKDRKEAEEMVELGDYAAFDSRQTVLGRERGGGMLRAKAIDDRLGCAVLLKLIQEPLPFDITFAFTVQEEIGTRGAFGVAFAQRPEIALVVESTTAADLPTVEPHKQVCKVGQGAVLPFMDGGTIYDRALWEQLTNLADRKGILWQTKQYIAGGTDAQAMQRSRAGVRVAGIAAPVRYIHSPANVVSLKDAQRVYELTRAFIDEMGKEPNHG